MNKVVTINCKSLGNSILAAETTCSISGGIDYDSWTPVTEYITGTDPLTKAPLTSEVIKGVFGRPYDKNIRVLLPEDCNSYKLTIKSGEDDHSVSGSIEGTF